MDESGDRKRIEVLIASVLQTRWPSKRGGGESLRENGMFRRDNNGQTTLNRTILDRAICYRIALCDDSDLRFCYHLLAKILARGLDENRTCI